MYTTQFGTADKLMCHTYPNGNQIMVDQITNTAHVVIKGKQQATFNTARVSVADYGKLLSAFAGRQ